MNLKGDFFYQIPDALIIDDSAGAVDSTYSSEKIEQVAGEVTLLTADYVLPLASTRTGSKMVLKNRAATPLTVSGYAPSGGNINETEKIDDETSQTLSPNDAMVIYSDGTEWYII